MWAGAASPADRRRGLLATWGVKTELALGAVRDTRKAHAACSLRGGMPYAVSVKDASADGTSLEQPVGLTLPVARARDITLLRNAHVA